MCPKQSPLITVPLTARTTPEKLSAMREAIASGHDVNAHDDEPVLGYNEGRPLDACFNNVHMAHGARVQDNLPVVELLLEHGADPRLKARSQLHPPIYHAHYYLEQAKSRFKSEEDEKKRGDWEEGLVFWGKVDAMFEEAVKRLNERDKNGGKGETEGNGDIGDKEREKASAMWEKVREADERLERQKEIEVKSETEEKVEDAEVKGGAEEAG
jgi:hypothetical protein